MNKFIFELQRFDEISNYDSNTLVSGTDEVDYISNTGGKNVTIQALGGNDSIYNEVKNVSINGGDGDDTISNFGGTNVSINGGAGNDSIDNNSNNVTINAGEGNDFINNIYGSNVLFVYGGGNDTITGFKKASTLSITGGEYSITRYTKDAVITVGENKITLIDAPYSVNVNGTTNYLLTINLNDDGEYFQNSSSQKTIIGGTGNDSIYNDYRANYVSIDSGKGNDSIENTGNNVTIIGGDDDDRIENNWFRKSNWRGNEVIINGGAGDDLIKSCGEQVTIYGGEGNDSIRAGKLQITIYGGEGNDSIVNDGSQVIIDGGADNDTIKNESSNNTISGGTGDDSIKNDASWGFLFKYLPGDGNDTINGFSSSSTIQIGDGNDTFSKDTVGNDVVVTVGDGSIILLGAATIADSGNLNINGTEVFNYAWTFDGTKAIYGKPNQTLVELRGVTSTDGLSINGKIITVSKKSLGTNTVMISEGDGYTLKLADDVTLSKTTKKWSYSKSTAAYKQTTTKGYKLDNNIISYYKAKTDTLLTVEGVTSADGLELNDTIVTVPDSVLNKEKVTISDGYSLALAKDVTQSKTVENWNYSNAIATYKKIITPGYTLSEDESSITYSTNEDDITVNVKGVKSKNGLSIDGTTVTVANSTLNKKTVTIDEGYDLALADDVAKSSTKDSWSYSSSTATLKRTTSTGYSLADDESSIAYSKQGTVTLAKVKGAKKTSGLTVDDNVITLKNAALNKKVTVSGSYEFDFAADYKKATITGSANEEIITTRGDNISINIGAGNDVINILGASTSINGGKGNDSITSNGKGNVFIYAAGDGNDIITNYAEDDKIKITSGAVSEATISGNDVVLTVGNEKITVKNAKGKMVTYIAENGIEYTYPESMKFNEEITAATLLSGFTKDKFNVANYGSLLNSIDASAVASDIEIIGNKLANDIKGSSQDDLINGNAGADTLDGGKGNDSLNGGAGNDSLYGGKGNDTLTGGKGADVFVFSKDDGKDLIIDYSEEDTLQFLSGTAKATTKKDDVIFTVGSGKITVAGGKDKIITYVDSKGVEYTYPKTLEYNKKNTSVKILATYNKDNFNVADYAEGLNTVDASAVTHDIKITGNKEANKITGSSQDDKLFGNEGADTILGGDGNDKIDGGSGNDSIMGGKGKDTLVGGDGSDIFVYSEGDGNDVIADYNEEDTIKFLSGTAKAATKKNDVIFTVGSGKITVKGGKDKIITCIDSAGVEYTYPKTLTYNEDSTSVKILAAYNKDSFNVADYGDELNTVNASAVKHDISITGNKKANKITGSSQDDLLDGAAGADTLEGGKGNDTLIGGKGNDKLYGGKGADSLWGGAGNDTLFGGDDADIFVFNGEGKDVIADFAEIDTIMVLNGKVGDYSARKGNVTFEVGNGSIVVQNAADKYIELVNSSGNRISYYSPKSS